MNREIKNFQQDVIEKSFNKPVLVDFWAEWCGPCRILSPVLDKLADKNGDRWELVKINTDQNQELSLKYGIRGIPNVKLFIDGKVSDEFTGALPEEMIKTWLKKAIPGRYQKDLEKAQVFIRENKEDEAEELLESVLRNDPHNDAASLLLAKMNLFSNPSGTISLLNNLNEIPENKELYDSLNFIVSLFSRESSLNDGEGKDIYLGGIRMLKEKNFEAALGNFIRVIRTNRMYDDDGARKACIAIFKYLGEEHEITTKFRRDFSSALYV